jgi:hypothetical protein
VSGKHSLQFTRSIGREAVSGLRLQRNNTASVVMAVGCDPGPSTRRGWDRADAALWMLSLSIIIILTSNAFGTKPLLVLCFSSVRGLPRHSKASALLFFSPRHHGAHSTVFHLFGGSQGSGGDPAGARGTHNHRNATGGRASPEGTNRTGVYRRIEDWHDDTHDPTHVIEHLKRERAEWSKKFEDLGGDGI